MATTWLTAGWVRLRTGGGAREAALFGDGEKGFELKEVHRWGPATANEGIRNANRNDVRDKFALCSEGVYKSAMTDRNRIIFFDTTLRDGEQSPGCTMHHEEKLRMAHQLGTLGVDVIEAGFPIASEGDFRSVQAIAREVRGARIAGLARAKREDIETAARAVEGAERNRIHTFLSSSDIHLEHQMKMSREGALELAGESVRLACSLVEDVEFSPMDARGVTMPFFARWCGWRWKLGRGRLTSQTRWGIARRRSMGR